MHDSDDLAAHLQDTILRLFQVVIPITERSYPLALRDIGICISRLTQIQLILVARHNTLVEFKMPKVDESAEETK